MRENFTVQVAVHWNRLPLLEIFNNCVEAVLCSVLCLSREAGSYDPLWSLPPHPYCKVCYSSNIKAELTMLFRKYVCDMLDALWGFFHC